MVRTSLATRGSVIATICLLGALGCQSTRAGAPQSSPAAPPAQPVARGETPAPTGAPQLEAVYFDFDHWDLRDDARATLQQNAKELQQTESWSRLTIEGHCDERGSEEYNLALGGKRAEVVSRYLKDLGVPATRLSTVSYGEEHPIAREHDEAAWQKNRRAELNLAPPRQASR